MSERLPFIARLVSLCADRAWIVLILAAVSAVGVGQATQPGILP